MAEGERKRMASYRLAEDVLEALEEAKWELRLSKAVIIERAVRAYLERRDVEDDDEQRG